MARSLNELLEMESYQGMTDEEINIVMAYTTEQAALQTAIKLRGEAIEQNYLDLVRKYEDAAKASDEAFRKVLEDKPLFRTV